MKKKWPMLIFCTVALLAIPVVAYASDSQSGGFLSNFFYGLRDIAAFFKNLFVPPENYFSNNLSILNDRLNKKLGGVGFLFQFLREFFNAMKSVPGTSLEFKIPDNYFFDGYRGLSLNFFSSAMPYIRMLRGVLTTSVCVFTMIACYHKLRTIFQQ